MLQQSLRHERARIETDWRARNQIAAAQGDEIGRARTGADEVNGHAVGVPAMAQVAPASLMRGTSNMEFCPAPASAAASAIEGTPNSSITRGERVATRLEAWCNISRERKTRGKCSSRAAAAIPNSFCL